MQRRLRRGVGRDGSGRDEGQTGAGDDESRWVGLGLENGQELERHVDDAGEVCVDLGVERLKIDLGGPRERHGELRAGVQEDAVEVGKRRVDPTAARQLSVGTWLLEVFMAFSEDRWRSSNVCLTFQQTRPVQPCQ